MTAENPKLQTWPVETPEDRVGLIYQMSHKSIQNPGMQKLARKIVRNVRARDEAGEVNAVFGFIKNKLPYRGDTRFYDTYLACYHSLDLAGAGEAAGGDCFPLAQKVIVRNKSTGFYELQRLGDLRLLWSNYDALSYDFTKSTWAFKPITGWSYRGEQETVDVRLHNGARFSCTPDHVFWGCSWSSKTHLHVDTCPISDLPKPGAGDRNPMVLVAKQIPVLTTAEVDTATAYLKGIYAAEGYADPKHVCIAQDKPVIREKIEAAFAAVDASFASSKRTKSAYYTVHVGTLKQELRALGTNSFDMQPAWDCLSGSGEAIQAYLGGNFDGDGCRVQRKGRADFFNQYTTSSEDLADGLRLGLMLRGRRQWWYKQLKHGGVGKQPIYRIYEHDPKESQRDGIVAAEFPGLRTVSVKQVTSGACLPVCDISVADTHNFVLADGTIAHNCDDHTGCLTALLWILGYATGCKIIGRDGQFTHIYAMVGMPRVSPTRWVPLDTTVERATVGWEPPKSARQLERRFLFARDGVYELT